MTNNVDMKVKLCLTCLSVYVTEPAAMKIGCYEPVYNFIQIIDLLKPNFEKSYGRMRKNGGFPQTFPVEYLGNGLQRRNSGCWSTPSIFLPLFSYVLDDRGMVERSHPQFPENRCWANGVQLQGPPNDKFEFFDGKRRRKGTKVEESRNANFRIRADPLPPPSQS